MASPWNQGPPGPNLESGEKPAWFFLVLLATRMLKVVVAKHGHHCKGRVSKATSALNPPCAPLTLWREARL